MSAADTYLVTLPPPTPNGGLHLGHVSGPFLAADVFVKAQALRGARCRTVTYADANQSYVRVTAERAGRAPDELARTFADDIRETLALYGAQVDAFVYPEGEANRFVRDLFARMSGAGALTRKPMPFFHSPSRGRILDEAGVSGFCPRCLAACKCGICEACAFPTAPGNLVAPRDAVSGDEALEIRSVEVLVLETERYRAAIRAFLDDRPSLRPRYRWLMEEALAGPLPDFPVTVPGDWGIAADAVGFAGQVINPWAEVMAQLLRLYRAAAPEGETPRVVNFYGFDNTYFYAIVHVALLAAAGEDRWLPHVAVINEFYNLEHRKFSTSNNHVVWARDLAGRVAPDAARFYAAFNTPGFEKGNFVEADMLAVLDDRITRPWGRLARRFNDGLAGAEGRAARASPDAVALGRAALDRVFASYALERFHLRQAAEDILHLLEFVEARLAAGRLEAADAAWMIGVLGQALLPIAPRAGEALYRRMTGRVPERLDLSGAVAPRPLAETLF